MENLNFISTLEDTEHISTSVPQQIEDAALKITAQFFSNELLPYFHIEGEVDHIAPTETVHLEVKKFYQDFNLVMKDGSWTHFEFQSNNKKALEDLKRFCTEEVFDNITYKLKNSIPLTKEDLVPLTLCPLMGGDIPQKDRIQKAFNIVRQLENNIPDTDKIEAVIYAMASKFLTPKELEEIKEEIKMTELGILIYNDGISQGIEQEALENAKNLLINGVSFELVRKSIHNISDETLREIYDEVMATKNA